MTQCYVAGELSLLIGDLCPGGCAELAAAMRDLRHRVECAPLSGLGPLAAEALRMADTACWTLLDRGDVAGFSHEAADAAVLHEFAICAALLP